MKSRYLYALSLFVMVSCTQLNNPFFKEYATPYGAIPFDKIKVEHYLPAFTEGIRQQQQEIQAITSQAEAPTFDNTIAALEASGDLLSRVSNAFFSLTSNETSKALQEIAQEVTPLLSEHNDNIGLNQDLFQRVKAVYDQRDQLSLTTEQLRVLENHYKSFVRSGALLSETDQQRLRDINKELSSLSLQFSDHVLDETNQCLIIVDNEADLSGLPKSHIDAAKEAAVAKGMPDKWVFSTQAPSRLPLLQYADNRSLREQMLKAYISRGDRGNESDNKAIAARMVNLRCERAQLLGYASHADYVLENQMAKTPEAVYQLLDPIWERALKRAKEETAELQALIKREGKSFKLEAWDWWYYAEKLRKEKYDFNEEQLKPYFKMENVREGLFLVANKLYGLSFKPVDNVPVYHPDVEVFEVNDADGSYLGLFYTDYYPREGKRQGAWMGNFQEQYVSSETDVRPHIYNVGNFSKPTADSPSLLSIDEVETMFHEFGHGLHGMLSRCNYRSVSGTSVPRDFVEMPSQIMENWCMHPDVLKLYAKHYLTGETIPDDLIAKISQASSFNQGFELVELLAASYLDMAWHTATATSDYDVNAFEQATLNRLGLIPEIVVRYRTTFFNHIFYSGYSAGYYAYTWAEVLDADAFQRFEEDGIFNRSTATLFRQNILERGGSEDPMILYRAFRAADPKPEALMRRRGL